MLFAVLLTLEWLVGHQRAEQIGKRRNALMMGEAVSAASFRLDPYCHTLSRASEPSSARCAQRARSACVVRARDSMPQVTLPPSRSAPKDTPRTLATGDQVILNGKLIVGTSGPARRARDWRTEYTARHRAGVGVFRDSNDVSRSPGGTALALLQQLGDIRLFVVPDGGPAPPSSDDPDLAEGWSRGAPLPMMSLVDGSRAAGECHVKLFLDAERTNAAVLHAMPRSHIIAMEFYPRPRDVPDGFRRSGNICGTVLLWSTRAGATAP